MAVELDAQEAAILRWLETEIDAAREVSDKAVRDARRLAASRPGDDAAQDALLRSLQGAFDAAMVEDEPTRVDEIVHEMVDVTRGMSDEDHLRALLHLAISKRQQGEVLEAETILRRVWGQANERVLPTLAVETGYWLVRILRPTRGAPGRRRPTRPNRSPERHRQAGRSGLESQASRSTRA